MSSSGLSVNSPIELATASGVKEIVVLFPSEDFCKTVSKSLNCCIEILCCCKNCCFSFSDEIFCFVARQKFSSCLLIPPFWSQYRKKKFFLFGCSHFFLLKFNFSLVLHRKFEFLMPLLCCSKGGQLPTQRESRRYVIISNKRKVKYLVIFIR